MSMRPVHAGRRPLCIAAVKSRQASSERVDETLKRLIGLVTALNVPARRLGIYEDPQDLAGEIARSGCMGLMLLVGSGGTEPIILEALGGTRIHTLLIGTEAYNSLPAMLEAYAALREQGRSWVHGVYLDLARLRESRTLLLQALRPLQAVIDVKFSRIGLVGEPGEWLVYSHTSPSDVKLLFGSEVVRVSLDRVLEEAESAEVSPRELAGMASVASDKVPRETLEAALRVYKALRRIAESYKLSGISINCFGSARVLGASPCYAVSRLPGDGVDAECEGSLSGLLALMIMRRLSGTPGMLANITAVRPGEITLSHCSAPLDVATGYMLEAPLEPFLGVSVAARLPQGRQVTLAKLDTRKGRLVAVTGRIRESGLLSTRQCRTQVIVKADGDVERLVDEPLGSHLALVIGNVMSDLKIVASLVGIKMERL